MARVAGRRIAIVVLALELGGCAAASPAGRPNNAEAPQTTAVCGSLRSASVWNGQAEKLIVWTAEAGPVGAAWTESLNIASGSLSGGTATLLLLPVAIAADVEKAKADPRSVELAAAVV